VAVPGPLAEAVFCAVLRALPACAREWFAALPARHLAVAVEEYSAAVVSPGLVLSGLAAAAAGARTASLLQQRWAKLRIVTKGFGAGRQRRVCVLP
jgi:hypothetical protein